MEQTANRIEAVRAFLESANRQFEEQGIYLGRALFKRDDEGFLTAVVLDYEDRRDTGTASTSDHEVKGGQRMIRIRLATPRSGKPGWYRTRSNPVSRKGGQRARDNPHKWLNANEMNSEKQDKNEQIKTKVK